MYCVKQESESQPERQRRSSDVSRLPLELAGARSVDKSLKLQLRCVTNKIVNRKSLRENNVKNGELSPTYMGPAQLLPRRALDYLEDDLCMTSRMIVITRGYPLLELRL
ncbi:uncharacterized protein LOC143024446 [Oratosquilla oratoria]|uniref:uncharacterized protein LOC143024446 n=1 Tax=Oratosquilla oratoria TaxID=337810 RepID=UPI003F75CB6A